VELLVNRHDSIPNRQWFWEGCYLCKDLLEADKNESQTVLMVKRVADEIDALVSAKIGKLTVEPVPVFVSQILTIPDTIC